MIILGILLMIIGAMLIASCVTQYIFNDTQLNDDVNFKIKLHNNIINERTKG